MDTFQGVVDRYNGVTVDTREEPYNSEQFHNKLIGNKLKYYILMYGHFINHELKVM